MVAENGQADSDAQTHGKKSNERNTSNNSKHHSLLLQVNLLWNLGFLFNVGGSIDFLVDFKLHERVSWITRQLVLF